MTCNKCGRAFKADVPYRLMCPDCSDAIHRAQKAAATREARMQTGDWHGGKIRLDRIYVRDKGVCGICGLPVPMDKSPENIWAATRDHIIPLSQGGAHTYANCQLAHRVCNSMKSDSLLPSFTVDWEEKLQEDPERWEGPLKDLNQQLDFEIEENLQEAL